MAHFSKQGQVTDAKIMYKNGRSRLFGFVGYKTDEMAEQAVKYFNNTFLHTSKLSVELAKQQNSEDIARPWSKYSTGSSANKRMLKEKGKFDRQANAVVAQKSAQISREEIENKKAKFKDFLKLMGKQSSKAGAHSWNDQFESFMGDTVIESTLKKDVEAAEAKREEDGGSGAAAGDNDAQYENSLVDDKRLYVMNLSY